MEDQLTGYLDALEHNDCYRVDAVLKESAQERTERVFLIGVDGSERGPFIRKRIKLDCGLGQAYERIWDAQRDGKRFLHLPRILECGIVGDCRIVVTEHVPGQTLKECVAERGPSQELLLSMGPMLCEAVMELHESFDPPLIHRDLKPSNVIVSSGDAITLVDFGIARTFDPDAERDTRQFGTRGYAPPEQFGYGQTDERSDVFALGMLLGFCVAGNDAERGLAQREFNDERIPQLLRAVLCKATAFDPDDRYASVRDLRDAFARAVNETRGTSKQNDVPLPPPNPPVAPSVTASVTTSRPKRTSRVPLWVGMVWNIIVCLAWGAVTVMSVDLLITDYLPFNTRPPIYWISIVMGVFVVAPVFIDYLLLDKRLLRRRIPFFAHVAGWRERVFCLCAAAGIVILVFVITVPIEMAMQG